MNNKITIVVSILIVIELLNIAWAFNTGGWMAVLFQLFLLLLGIIFGFLASVITIWVCSK